MFGTKKKSTKKFTVPTVTTKTESVDVPTAAFLKAKAYDEAKAAKARLTEQSRDTKKAAAVGLAAASAYVAPKVADAKGYAAPRVDEAKQVLEDEVLPRVAEARDYAVDVKDQLVHDALPKIVGAALSGGALAPVAKLKDSDTVQRAADAKAVLKGDAVAKYDRGGRGFLKGLAWFLGLVGLSGVIAYVVNGKAKQQDDPWARPLAEPYVPPTTGRDSTVPAAEKKDDAATATVSTAPGAALTTQTDDVATFTPAAGEVVADDGDLIPSAEDGSKQVFDDDTKA